MDYEIIEHEATQVVGISVRTTNEDNQAAKDIGETWKEFHTSGVFDQIPNKNGTDIVGLYTNYEKDHTKPYTFIAGFFVSSVPDIMPPGLAQAHLPKSKYALFHIDGPFPQALQDAWEYVWESDLKRTYTGDCEIYKEDFHPVDNPKIDLYIAIE